MWLGNKKIKNVCWQKASCSGDTLLCSLVASWSSLSWCHPSLAANTFWIFYPATGLFDYNFPRHVPLGASTTSTTSGHPPLQHLLLDCFILIFFSPARSAAAQQWSWRCNATWQSVDKIACTLWREVNGPITFPAMHTFRGGGGKTPNTAPSTTQNSTCSTYAAPGWLFLLLIFKNFQTKIISLYGKEIQVLLLELLKMCWMHWMHWTGWFGEKKILPETKKIIPVRKYRITKLEFRCFYILVRICKKFFSGSIPGTEIPLAVLNSVISIFVFFFPTQYTKRGSTDFSRSQKKIFWGTGIPLVVLNPVR